MTAGGIFVCGTDTGIGKTHVAVALVEGLRRGHGLRVAVMKPVASGCTAGRNEDAERLIAASGLDLDYGLVNPHAFERPIAPHLAAAGEGRAIEPRLVVESFAALAARADLVVVEGAGGVAVPLSGALLQSDLVRMMGLPVLLVVGMRLGCLSQALLTMEHLEARGIPVVGWVANLVDPSCEAVEGNIATLAERIAAPLLATIGHGACSAADRGAIADAVVRVVLAGK